MTVAVCLASSGLWQGWCPTYARVPHRFHHHCNVVGTVGREESYFEKETSQGSVYHQEGVPMQVRKLVGRMWMALLLLLLVFCGSELQEADGWLSIFSWSLFKREDSCGLCHSDDFTTHTLSWLPSPSSSSLMKFATIWCRAVFFVLEATLMCSMKSCKGNFWYN